jgi:hypothetical protein
MAFSAIQQLLKAALQLDAGTSAKARFNPATTTVKREDAPTTKEGQNPVKGDQNLHGGKR